jgi:DNA-binding CsgD family transcriptional regulator
MLDAVAKCRLMAAELNASIFGVFVSGQSIEGTRLVPCFDSDFPALGAATVAIAGAKGEELARHTRLSTVPCWWPGGNSAWLDEIRHLDWMALTSTLIGGVSGVAFPVQAERGVFGVVLFAGPDLALDTDTLIEAHARCFALFAAVVRQQPSRTAKLPAMSRRELECLKLTANGYTSDEIAGLLKLSVHTANQYLTKTAQKLDAVNRVHAVAKALRLGLIE